MQSNGNANVETDLYLVRNPGGAGKSVVRRPRPPPTTTALDEDFDAITVDDTTTFFRGPRIDEGQTEVGSSTGDQITRRTTYHADAKEYGNFAWRGEKPEGSLSELTLGLGKAASTSGSAVKGSQKGEGSRMRQNAVRDDDSRRLSRVTEESRLSRSMSLVGKGLDASASNIETIPEDILEQEEESVKTWREQVAQSGDQSHLGFENFTPDDTATEKGGSVAGTVKTSQTVHQAVSSEQEKPLIQEPQPSSGGRSSPDKKKRSEPAKSVSSPSKAARSERIYSAADLDTPPPPSNYSPSEFAIANNMTSPARPKRMKDTAEQIRPSVSTRGSSFTNHRSSGSIKLVSSESMDTLLSSFRPSLLHIGPILASLGMIDIEHLQAVAGLSDETRDREVKEVALKKGLTVVEWAMLLDRVRSL